MTNDKIVGTMTIREAAAHWSDPRKGHLKRWAETFGVSLQELHPGHVVTCQKDRALITPRGRPGSPTQKFWKRRDSSWQLTMMPNW
jgi:hypothetical protein